MNPLTNAEIDDVERRLGVTLPGLYRKLLVEEGHGAWGQRAGESSNTTKEILHPERVHGIYDDFFDDPSQVFTLYFPFGYDNHTQEVWVIDARQEKVASIWHETVPDDWPEEEWLSYEEWVRRHLEG